MRTEKRLNKIEEVLRCRQLDLTVVMENIHDPHNVSAILRSCDASGIMNVNLIYNSTDFPDIGKKSSASAKKWIGLKKYKNVQDCYDNLRAEGFKIYATHLSEKSSSIYDIDLTEKIAIVVGNEHSGVSQEAAALADHVIKIPMFGMIQSLNVSVATAIIVFEAVRQRIDANNYYKSQFSEIELKSYIKEWALKK